MHNNQRSEVGSRKSEVGSQRSGVRSQRSEVRGQRSEVRGQRSEVRGQKVRSSILLCSADLLTPPIDTFGAGSPDPRSARVSGPAFGAGLRTPPTDEPLGPARR